MNIKRAENENINGMYLYDLGNQKKVIIPIDAYFSGYRQAESIWIFKMNKQLKKVTELKEKIKKVNDVFSRVYVCECKYTDEGGNCTDCENNRVLIYCELSGEVFHQLYKV